MSPDAVPSSSNINSIPTEGQRHEEFVTMDGRFTNFSVEKLIEKDKYSTQCLRLPNTTAADGTGNASMTGYIDISFRRAPVPGQNQTMIVSDFIGVSSALNSDLLQCQNFQFQPPATLLSSSNPNQQLHGNNPEAESVNNHGRSVSSVNWGAEIIPPASVFTTISSDTNNPVTISEAAATITPAFVIDDSVVKVTSKSQARSLKSSTNNIASGNFSYPKKKKVYYPTKAFRKQHKFDQSFTTKSELPGPARRELVSVTKIPNTLLAKNRTKTQSEHAVEETVNVRRPGSPPKGTLPTIDEMEEFQNIGSQNDLQQHPFVPAVQPFVDIYANEKPCCSKSVQRDSVIVEESSQPKSTESSVSTTSAATSNSTPVPVEIEASSPTPLARTIEADYDISPARVVKVVTLEEFRDIFSNLKMNLMGYKLKKKANKGLKRKRGRPRKDQRGLKGDQDKLCYDLRSTVNLVKKRKTQAN